MTTDPESRSPILEGVFAPLVTPFSGDAPDLEALRFNLRRLQPCGLSGYVLLGSNGEFRALAERERTEVLELCATEVTGKRLIAGVSGESVAQVRDHLEQCLALGFDVAAIQPPSYFAKSVTQAVILRFFTELADHSPLPILLYNAPSFLNGVSISPTTMAVLASHPRIAGVKDSGASGPFGYLAACEDSGTAFCVLAGSATVLYPALHAGATGGVVSLGNVVPELCCSLYDLYRAGEYTTARQLHNRIVRLNAAISGSFGVAGVKAAMTLCGYRGGTPRPPLELPAGTELEAIDDALRHAGVI